MWNPFRRKEGQVKSLQQPVVNRGGWAPMFSYVHEPYAGAWQQNMEI